MDWTLAIDLNRMILLRLVAEMFAMMGLEPGASGGMVSRRVHSLVLWILRPAESAARRLIAVVWLKTDVSVRVQGQGASGTVMPRIEGAGRAPAFALFDPRISTEPWPRRKTTPGYGPRIWNMDGTDAPAFERKTPLPDDLVSAKGVCRRLAALRHALEDLPRQVRRLVRARARMVKPIPPMRPARAPGYRAKRTHEVDEVLHECGMLAEMARRDAEAAVKAPDTS